MPIPTSPPPDSVVPDRWDDLPWRPGSEHGVADRLEVAVLGDPASSAVRDREHRKGPGLLIPGEVWVALTRTDDRVVDLR